MSLGTIFLIREPVLRGIAIAGGCLSVLLAGFISLTRPWNGDESRAILFVPFVYGFLFIGVAAVFRGYALRVTFISVLAGFPAMVWVGGWFFCATALLGKAACA